MIFLDVFKRFRKNLLITIHPILFDLLALLVSFSILGFYGESVRSSKLILEMGLPSVSHISNIPFLVNNIDFFTIQVDLLNTTYLIVLGFIILGAFIQGGYIGHLQAIASDQEYNFSKFLKAGRQNWIQFIILEIIIFFGKIFVITVFVSFYQAIGGVIALAIFFVLRCVFIYLEMTMVVDRKGVAKAFSTSWGYFKKTPLITIPLILIYYLISTVTSLALHLLWSEATVVIMIIFYGIIMSYIQLVFMRVITETKQNRRFTL